MPICCLLDPTSHEPPLKVPTPSRPWAARGGTPGKRCSWLARGAGNADGTDASMALPSHGHLRVQATPDTGDGAYVRENRSCSTCRTWSARADRLPARIQLATVRGASQKGPPPQVWTPVKWRCPARAPPYRVLQNRAPGAGRW
eukprot:scaffold885_cov381-Prasinococcus_capsulatus_cf.AAC.7